MLLADAAQVSEGKLYILGGGWTFTGPGPQPSAIAMHFEIPWNETNRRHHWRLDLVDSDDDPVTINGEPVVLRGAMEAGRPPGTPPGTPIPVALAINLGPIPLDASRRYEWRLTVGTETRDEWRLAFNTRPAGELPAG